MTPRQRIVLLLIAAVILVGGIALAASSGGDDEPEQSGPATTLTQTEPAGGEKTSTTAGEPEPPAPRVDTIRIRGGKPVGGAKTLEYESGDTIRLRFVSDAPGEVHIHGFDRYVQVGSSPRTARFTANLEGIFEVEEHGSGEILATLEIRPK